MLTVHLGTHSLQYNNTIQHYLLCIHVCIWTEYCKLQNFENPYSSKFDAITDKMLGRFGSFKSKGFNSTIWHSFTSFHLSEFPNLLYKFSGVTYRRPWASWIALIWSSTVILAWAAFCVAAMLHKHKQCI